MIVKEQREGPEFSRELRSLLTHISRCLFTRNIIPFLLYRSSGGQFKRRIEVRMADPLSACIAYSSFPLFKYRHSVVRLMPSCLAAAV